MTYEEFQKNACKAAKILLDAIIESNKNIWNKGKEQSIKEFMEFINTQFTTVEEMNKYLTEKQ